MGINPRVGCPAAGLIIKGKKVTLPHPDFSIFGHFWFILRHMFAIFFLNYAFLSLKKKTRQPVFQQLHGLKYRSEKIIRKSRKNSVFILAGDTLH